MFRRPPNTRVQRTRSSPSALRSPLTRHPLGDLSGAAMWGGREEGAAGQANPLLSSALRLVAPGWGAT